MSVQDAFRRCLVELDVDGVCRLWSQVQPNLSQPTPENALVTIHIARTAAESIPFNLRAYSHAWLRERSFPSQLPDKLKPRAERIYPVIVTAVGISVMSLTKRGQPAALRVRKAMEDAVLDAYSINRSEPEFVKARMSEAVEKAEIEIYGHKLDPERERF